MFWIGGGEDGGPVEALKLALEPPGEDVAWEELAVLRVLTDAGLEEALLVLGGGLRVFPGEKRLRIEEAWDKVAGDWSGLAMAAWEIKDCLKVGIGEKSGCEERSDKTMGCEHGALDGPLSESRTLSHFREVREACRL